MPREPAATTKLTKSPELNVAVVLGMTACPPRLTSIALISPGTSSSATCLPARWRTSTAAVASGRGGSARGFEIEEGEPRLGVEVEAEAGLRGCHHDGPFGGVAEHPPTLLTRGGEDAGVGAQGTRPQHAGGRCGVLDVALRLGAHPGDLVDAARGGPAGRDLVFVQPPRSAPQRGRCPLGPLRHARLGRPC